jgi:hypothetical protein
MVELYATAFVPPNVKLKGMISLMVFYVVVSVNEYCCVVAVNGTAPDTVIAHATPPIGWHVIDGIMVSAVCGNVFAATFTWKMRFLLAIILYNVTPVIMGVAVMVFNGAFVTYCATEPLNIYVAWQRPNNHPILVPDIEHL